jgi:hypothetical protein
MTAETARESVHLFPVRHAYRFHRLVPAFDNKGEGIFLQFSKTAIQSWLANASLQKRLTELAKGFDAWRKEHPGGTRNVLAMHPTVKPVALVADALLDCSARGEIVLDSFLGSGSTLLAAERVGRVCYALEIEPRYVDLAIRRWQKLTGERATRAISGIAFDELAATEAPHA